MTPTHVTCPRCDGKGRITVYPDGGPRVRADCPTYRGTGQASLLEPMGTPSKEKS